MSQSVTVVVMHIAHNASDFGGPDRMHYEQVYCTPHNLRNGSVQRNNKARKGRTLSRNER